MINLARQKVEAIDSRKERKEQRRELQRRLLLAREGSNAERWGQWGSHEKLQDRPKI